ncbi:hypothetical protein SAMD00019534_090450 [Acytostelium subglobosum LB1]|uniref:hypothetical protein n=1 Tax=Acytostelium subglobosum LB1 TaxID=1410327 RepID=UPI000644C449|nr:hypothetical protein SAMD00019534_090450 [Acytostelium subglobosum LB1]GAM25870.1 hypothetical protein SAMD00019534_090450 [Acytostelium subglobosum LB1]|eukprot:XP_012751388.1 hypothetical protein SAMD00019534_090450 [Acytostelium subglobosum LB1]
MSLKGKTIFITGASRGIGKEIALRAAKDGANIIIAAKTADTNPKLPGTIYSAQKEIEAAGGQCVACVCDIRSEEQIEAAVRKGVERFGGIDILINNASAISLTGTLETPSKKFDLMMGINTRGTYLTTQKCLPYLLKSSNPHVLNISPPLNMNSRWFKNHTAYTMAKYGMSMCVLGMAEEYRGQIAFNALWPRTAIFTAAMEMLAGHSQEIKSECRKPAIMSDSAHWILTQPQASVTGQFFIDEDIVSNRLGVKDLDIYAYVPGHALMLDFFLEEEGYAHQQMKSKL